MRNHQAAAARGKVPLFYPFAVNPPEAESCLDRLYSAFADYRIAIGWCRQCFTPDEERNICALRHTRTAPLSGFSPIYHEHPNCSGGEATFLHWLPRGLELGFFDPDIEPDLVAQAMRLCLWHWPDEEQAALRDLFGRIAINWFQNGNAAPLEIPDRAHGVLYGREFVSGRIIQALLYLRSEPAELFDWLMTLDKADAWTCLFNLLNGQTVFGGPVYHVLDDDQATVMKAGHDALERIARDALHEALLTDDRLLRAWTAAEGKDRKLGAAIADAEWLVSTNTFFLTLAERAGDEARLRAALPLSASNDQA